MNELQPNNDRRNLWIPGALMLGMGLFMVLLSLGVIEGHTVSSRRALFHDARHWQLTAFGLVFALVGVSLWIPRRLEALGRFNAMALLLAILFAGTGSIWYGSGGAAQQKGGSMTAFLDSIARWFQSVGMHPVSGAFIAGVVIAFVFAYRRSPPPADMTSGGGPAARPAFPDNGMMASHGTRVKVTIGGRTVELPAEVIAHVEAGNKIEAIKALRNVAGLGLKEAKDAVDAIVEARVIR